MQKESHSPLNLYSSHGKDINSDLYKRLSTIKVGKVKFMGKGRGAPKPAFLLTEIEATSSEANKKDIFSTRELYKIDKDAYTVSKQNTVPAFYISQDFYGKPTHIGCLDIDRKDNFDIDFAAVMQELQDVKWILQISFSLSNDGFYILFPYTEGKDHKQAMQAAMDELYLLFGIVCDDLRELSRLRAYSYDPNYYINWNATDFDFDETTEEHKAVKPKNSFSDDFDDLTAANAYNRNGLDWFNENVAPNYFDISDHNKGDLSYKFFAATNGDSMVVFTNQDVPLFTVHSSTLLAQLVANGAPEGKDSFNLYDLTRYLTGKAPFELTKELSLVGFGLQEWHEKKEASFYSIAKANKVITSPMMYANYLMGKNFVRIATGDGRIRLIKDTNNVIKFYDHVTELPRFLVDCITEDAFTRELVANQVARDSNNVIKQALLCMPSAALEYYSDEKDTFGLPFANGFFSTDKSGEVTSREYSEVKGFFAPHPKQDREFILFDEVGVFETFFNRAVTGVKYPDIDQEPTIKAFQSMVGYMVHSFKDATDSPCVVLTDHEADGNSRNGGRGKSLITRALLEAQKGLVKGGIEFNTAYNFYLNDLQKEHNIYVIDDVPANFKYQDLYTNILGDISCQRKGLAAELIPFAESPKFIITTNWVLPYDAENASTNRRFAEYKLTPYYNMALTPNDELKSHFFDGWDSTEWSKFYSFIFRCVTVYLNEGLIRIPYDKTEDNFKVAFYNDATFEAFETTFDLFTKEAGGKIIFLTVSKFLEMYSIIRTTNDRLINQNNAKHLINVWLEHHGANYGGFKFEYSKRARRWDMVRV